MDSKYIYWSTLSGYILNYVVTPASVNDIRAVDDLLENCSQPYVLYELREQLKQKGYHLWTPLRQKMVRAKQHNHWKLMAMRRTIETRFSELCAFLMLNKH